MAQCEACSGPINARGVCTECGAVDHHRPDPPARVNGVAATPAREEVAAMDPAERRALMAELLPKLAAETARALTLRPAARKWNGDVTEAIGDPEAEAHLPYPRGSEEDMAWRRERALTSMQQLADYCARHGIDWHTGRETRPITRELAEETT